MPKRSSSLDGGVQTIDVALDKIIPTPDNARKITTKKQINDLALDIKQRGLLQPGIARPHPDKPGYYDLRAGARRLAAHQQLERPTMRIELRNMTDAEAMAVTFAENYQRKDLHPLDEARTIETMLKQPDVHSLNDVAKHFGISANQAARRLKLLDLSPEWKQELRSNSIISLLPATHLEEVARLPHASQNNVLEECQYLDILDLSLNAFRRHICAWIGELESVPWASDDADLVPEAGPCTTCQKRAAHDDCLWQDMKLNDRGACLDNLCYTRKHTAWLTRLVDRTAQKTGQKPVLYRGNNSAFPSSAVLRDVPATVAFPHEYERCKKSAEGAIPAIRIDADGLGKTLWLRPDKYKRQRDAATAATKPQRELDPDTGKPKPLPLKEKRKALQARRDKYVIGEARLWLIQLDDEALGDEARLTHIDSAITAKPNIGALVASFGQLTRSCHARDNAWQDYDKLCTQEPLESQRHIMVELARIMADRLACLSLADVPHCLKELKRIAGIFPTLPLNTLTQEAVKEIPEPKSWTKGQDAAGQPPLDGPDTKLADKLEHFALGLQKNIDDKHTPRPENTRKRFQEACHRRFEASNLERAQLAMRALAQAHRAGTLPAGSPLRTLRTKKQILELTQNDWDGANLADTGKLCVQNETSHLLLKLVNDALTPEQKSASAQEVRNAVLQRKLAELRLRKISGYFPTPPQVATLVVDAADIHPGDRVLEPSAGTGELADVFCQLHPGAAANLTLNEVNPELADILKLKGYKETFIHTYDFLAVAPEVQLADTPDRRPYLGRFKRIIMNPPFEHGQDRKHIQHAFQMLQPGGRLVSIVGAGVLSRTSKADAAFRDWLKPRLARQTKLAPDAFAVSGTNVQTYLLVLDHHAT